MAKNIRIRAVRRESVDIDKLVSGLMLLLEEIAAAHAGNDTRQGADGAAAVDREVAP